jgi:hypothetical protein
MVPADLQRAVWATYRRGQEIRKDPSRAYLAATQAAVDAVDRLEQEAAALAARTAPPNLFDQENM